MRTLLLGFAVIAIASVLGCAPFGFFSHSKNSQALYAILPNPAPVPNVEPEFLWNQIVDTVDDYFQIDEEQRAQKSGTAWMDGKLTTVPDIGSTYLEPWRRETTLGYQRLQSTFQTIRRTAIVTVIPDVSGYRIGVEVKKDLEDVDRSQYSAEGSASVRHDGAVVRSDQGLVGAPITLGWIPIERDTELEQKILREIVGRVTNVGPPQKRLLHH